MTFTKLLKHTVILAIPYFLFTIVLLASGHQMGDTEVFFCLGMLVLPPLFAFFIDENPFLLNGFIAMLLVGVSFILLTRMPIEIL